MVSNPVWLRRVQHQQAIMEPTASRVVKPTLSTILSKKGVSRSFIFGWRNAPDQNITGSIEPNSLPYPLSLSALKDLEMLVEIVAQHYYGDDRKWKFLAITEGIRVLVRLSLFRKSGYKMFLHGRETSNDDSFSQIAANLKGCYNVGTNLWNLEGRALPALS
ncbi:hypothetical protein RYX36_010928 [Vicia faba]